MKIKKIKATLLLAVLILTTLTATTIASAQLIHPIPYLVQESGLGSATRSTTQVTSGLYSVYIDTGPNVIPAPAGMGRIRFMMPEGTTLNDIDTMSWEYFLEEGYPPHVDIYLDTDEVPGFDDCLTFEYANNDHSGEGSPTYGALTGGWYTTFDDDTLGPSAVDDSAIAWSNSGGNSELHTLSDWKSGITAGGHTISGDTPVTLIQFQMHSDLIHSKAYIDDIEINGYTYDLEPIVLDVERGSPGTSIIGTGCGFDADQPGIVWFDSIVNDVYDEGEPMQIVTSDADGSIDFELTVPDVLADTYDIRADIPLGDPVEVYALFEVPTPTITIAPTSGPVDTMIAISGSDFKLDTDVTIFFDLNLNDEVDPGETVTTLHASIEDGSFTDTFNIPTLPDEEYVVGAYDGVNYDALSKTFDVNPKITLNPDEGPVEAIITVTGTGFGSEEEYTVSDELGTVTTEVDGTFTTTVTIPSTATHPYTIMVGGVSTYYGVIQAAITLDPIAGTIDTDVLVSGVGFTPNTAYDIWFDSGEEVGVDVDDEKLADVTTNAAGEFEETITIPIVPGAAYDIMVILDGETDVIKSTGFTVEADIVLTPDEGPVGTEVTVYVTGYGAGEVYTITGVSGNAEDDGTFTAIVTIPDIPETYEMVVLDESSEPVVSAFFTVLTPAITINPSEGPPGTEITISGADYLVGASGYVWFDTSKDGIMNPLEPFAEVIVDTDGIFIAYLTVPDEIATEYFVRSDIPADDSNEDFASFTIPQPSISISPEVGLPGEEITVVGNDFKLNAEVTVFIDYDSEGDLDPNEEVATATADDTGFFTTDFLIPTIPGGMEYQVMATDSINIADAVGLTISAIDPVFEIYTRSLEYLRGDTISIYGKCSGAPESVILDITDQDGRLFWISETLITDDWESVGGWDLLKWSSSIVDVALPSDAPLGSWTFTAYDGESNILDTNSFDVLYSPTLTMILDRLDELDDVILTLITDTEDIAVLIETGIGTVIADLGEIADLITDAKAEIIDEVDGKYALLNTELGLLKISVDAIPGLITDAKTEIIDEVDGKYALLNTELGLLKISVDDLDADLVDLDGDVAAISTTLGDLQVSLAAIDAKLVNLEGTLATISTDIGTITTSLESIDLKVTSIQEDIATIETSLETLEGLVTSIDDNIATIVTDIGTIQVDVSAILNPETGTLSITTTPVDGEVFVDGVFWGTAPQEKDVLTGAYTITFGDMTGYTAPSAEEAVVTADTTTAITGTYIEVQPITDISLSVGWNLVSLPLMPDDSSIEVVLEGLVGVESVWSYDEGWYSYRPGAPSGLTEMVDGVGYWIDMSASATLTVSGTEMPTDPMAPMPEYPVVEGWNLMGFKSTYTMTVSEYLLGVDYVRVYEYVDGYNTLSANEYMTPGRGYWISVSEPGTIYP